MEIQSAFNSGIQGFQKAREEASQAAENIAVSTAMVNEEVNLNVSSSEASSVNISSQNDKSLPDLNQSIVDLKVAEFQAKASVQIIKSADESLGTLLDVTA